MRPTTSAHASDCLEIKKQMSLETQQNRVAWSIQYTQKWVWVWRPRINTADEPGDQQNRWAWTIQYTQKWVWVWRPRINTTDEPGDQQNEWAWSTRESMFMRANTLLVAMSKRSVMYVRWLLHRWQLPTIHGRLPKPLLHTWGLTSQRKPLDMQTVATHSSKVVPLRSETRNSSICQGLCPMALLLHCLGPRAR